MILAVTVTQADIWMIALNVVLLGVLAALSVAEMGLTRTSRVRAQALAEGGHRSGARLAALVANPERFVNPILLTVNICQTVQTTLTAVVAGRVFGPLGVVIGAVLNVIVFFVLAEALPKTWAVLHPDRAALVTAGPVSALVAFWPLRVVSQLLIGLTNWLVPGKGLKQGPFVSEQELLATVEAAANDDVIELEERELIESIIEFGDTVAREVMVPRPDMVTVADTATVTEALDVLIQRGYSRVPVIGEETDEVDGLAYAKDLMRAEREGRGADAVSTLVREAVFVPETKPVAHLMRQMQSQKFHMALVVDEYGSTVGLVTLEDCIEELVGDIVDEFDREDPEVEHLAGGELRVQGGYSVDDLNELLGTDLPDDDWDTVGGFVLGVLGHVPEPGECVHHDGWRFTAERLDGRRIATVRIRPSELAADAPLP